MKEKDMESKAQFLATEYKDSLTNGFIETPSQFMMRMKVDPKIEKIVRPLLKEVEEQYNNSKK